MSDIGHNEPPDELTILKDRLSLLYAHLIKRREEILKAQQFTPVVISTDDEAKRMVDFREMVRAASKAAKDAHKAEKAYFWRAGKVCDSFFLADIDSVLSAVEKSIEPRLRNWQEHLRQEGRSGKVTGELGKTASLSSTWRWRVIDISVVAPEWLIVNAEKMQKRIDDRPDKKDAPLPIHGIEFYKETKSR